MKAVLLAAGKGSRLGSLTATIPKPLLEVEGKPILQHNVELCQKHGITELFINTHHLAEKIKEYFGDGRKFGVSITYSYEPELLGTAGALNSFKQELAGEPFFVIYGDNISDYDLSMIYRFHDLRNGIGTIALFEKEDVSMSGIAAVNGDGTILRFVEKPAPEDQFSHLVSAGIFVLSPRVFEYIPSGFSDFGKDILPNVISRGEKLYGIVMKGWLDWVDTIDSYNMLRRRNET